MTTSYAPIMEAPEDQVVVHITPPDAKKFIQRIRKVSFFVRTSVDLYTEFDDETGRGTRGFMDMGGCVPISMKVAVKMMDDMIRFSAMKAEKDGVECKVKLTRLGQCLFIG